MHICTDLDGLVRLGKNVVILSSPIRESEMATFARANAAPQNVELDSFRVARTSMTPKSELALTSLVIVVLVAGAAIVSIAALAKQSQYGTPGVVMLMTSPAAANADATMALHSYNTAEAVVPDRDLYPFCLNVGDSKLPSTRGGQVLGRDSGIFEVSAGGTTGHASLAAATGGQATGAGFIIPRPAADGAPRRKAAVVAQTGDLGCGVGNYK